MFKKFNIFFISLISFLISQSDFNQNIITVIATTNVHGETDPCG